jgi:hypothetical protein
MHTAQEMSQLALAEIELWGDFKMFYTLSRPSTAIKNSALQIKVWDTIYKTFCTCYRLDIIVAKKFYIPNELGMDNLYSLIPFIYMMLVSSKLNWPTSYIKGYLFKKLQGGTIASWIYRSERYQQQQHRSVACRAPALEPFTFAGTVIGAFI